MTIEAQGAKIQYAALDTDFQYKALGSTGQLGGRSVESLEPGTVRQSDRIAGPQETLGRWFSRLLDSITPHSWRQQGKFYRALENFSAQTGNVLGCLHNLSAAHTPGLSGENRAELRRQVLAELAALRPESLPMTSRGADYDEILKTRVRVNLGILQRESPEQLTVLFALESNNELDSLIRSLDPDTQAELAADLRLIQAEIRAAMPERQGEAGVDGVDAERRLDMMKNVETRIETESAGQPEPRAEPYVSRHEESALNGFFANLIPTRNALENILRRRGAALDETAGAAERSLRAAIEVINRALGAHSLTADPESFAQIRDEVERHMKEAIRSAADEVCAFALKHAADKPMGGEGTDFARITPKQVDNGLAVLRTAVHDKTGVSMENLRPSLSPGQGGGQGDAFAEGVAKARARISELSAMYGEMIDGLAKVEENASRYRLCLALRRLAGSEPPPGVSPRQFGEACDELIDAILNPPADTRVIEGKLSRMNFWLSDMSESGGGQFRELIPQLRHFLLDAPGRRPVAIDTSQHNQRLAYAERLHALHQVIAGAGALLQQSGLPQADELLGQALRLSSLVTEAANTSALNTERQRLILSDLRTGVSRLMADIAQARMQLVNPEVRCGFIGRENAGEVKAQDGLAALDKRQEGIGLLLTDFSSARPGQEDVERLFREGAHAADLAAAAASACAKIPNPDKTMSVAFEQLAVCAASGRTDAAGPLQDLLASPAWEKTPEARSAKQAILAFLEARQPLAAARGQDTLLRFIANRIGYNIIAHDISLGLDGSLRLLINTDRQRGGRTQGVRWITLPPPESLPATGKIDIGVNRLNEMLMAADNRTQFYPQFYSMMHDTLTHRAFYDFSLPE